MQLIAVGYAKPRRRDLAERVVAHRIALNVGQNAMKLKPSGFVNLTVSSI
jgi:hypothetical protein